AHVQTLRAQRRRSPARRNQLDTLLGEQTRKCDKTCFIGNRDQRAPDAQVIAHAATSATTRSIAHVTSRSPDVVPRNTICCVRRGPTLSAKYALSSINKSVPCAVKRQ